jgi:hypothetical protein
VSLAHSHNKRKTNKMKLNIKTILKAGMPGLLAFAAVSCESTGAGDTAGRSAVSCDRCKTVWVQRVSQAGGIGKSGSAIIYRNEKAMQCPDCENAIATFFKTGKLKHHCDHCGGTMIHCEH